MLLNIENPSDPRLSPYRDLRASNPVDGFVAEGHWIAERLLQSPVSVRSLLVSSHHAEHYESLVPSEIPVFVAENEIIQSIVGYNFHRGVLSHGSVPPLRSMNDFVTSNARHALALVGITDPENVGGLLRSAAAFGIQDVFIGPRTLDPYLRRVIRVSMGSAFFHRFYKFDEPLKQLAELSRCEVVSIATTLDPQAEPIGVLCERLAAKRSRFVLLMGNEADGLPDSVQASATIRSTLPMTACGDSANGVDSLNVGVAGGIFMYELLNKTAHQR